MAFTYGTTPANFKSGEQKSETRYLDLAGLVSFWSKVKTYVDEADGKVFTALNQQSDAYNAAIRAYIESLTINGLTVSSDKNDEGNNGVGFNLEVELGGEDIKVRRVKDESADVAWKVKDDSGNTVAWDVNKAARGYSYSDGNWKVDDAIENIDARLDAVQSELLEGVVSGLNVTSTHGKYNMGTDATDDDVENYEWVKVTGTAYSEDKQVGDLTLNIDDTAINTKFNGLDEKLNFLEANAGVTNIKVADVDDETATNKGLVELSLKGTKLPNGNAQTDAAGVTDAFRRGDIEIILDESGLDGKLDEIDTAVATEVADRKEDIANLAGDNYTVADGATAGTWSADTSYTNITKISERLDEIDANLVAKIVDGNDGEGENDKNAENEKYVSFEVKEEQVEGGGVNDKTITLTLNDNKLQDYISETHEQIKKLDGITINGYSITSVSTETDAAGYEKLVVGHTDITLDTEDIRRPSADGNGALLEDTLKGYDAKMTALASATHFRGAYGTKELALAAIKDQGDVVIIGNKEYVYYDPNVTDDNYKDNGDFKDDYTRSADYLVELGDTEAETQRIAAIENWIDTNIISVNDMENSTYFNWETPTYTA